MPTNKPQFNVYLDPGVHQEIDQHATRIGAKKGKLVESMWRFFNLRDLPGLHDKLAAKVSNGLVEKERSEILQLFRLLQRTVESPNF